MESAGTYLNFYASRIWEVAGHVLESLDHRVPCYVIPLVYSKEFREIHEQRKINVTSHHQVIRVIDDLRAIEDVYLIVLASL